MSITATLSSALSGLTATARVAEVVSSNVANALTPGYARREVDLAARQLGDAGQGVSVVGVQRQVDAALLSDRRIAEAEASGRDVTRAFLARLEGVLGTGSEPGSLSGRVSRLDASLLEAAGRPESQARLSAVLDAAKGLASGIADAAREVQAARTGADRQVAGDVARLNATLRQVQDMNIQIRTMTTSGRDASAMMDQRQRLIDGIATLVPLREVDRGQGQLALFTIGGAPLLDGRAATVGFDPAGLVTEDMTLASGALSSLTLDGQVVPPAFFAGGRIAGALELRDAVARAVQGRLDALARDLVGRFADPALDATLPLGAPGLFTDAGAPFTPANELGLAARLTVNSAVDPVRGGALWRLRDGLGAAAPGNVGNASLLTAMERVLTEARFPASGGSVPGARSTAGLATDLVSEVAGRRLSADANASFASTRLDALRVQELEGGVDTDREMQSLLQIENAYAANARVVQTVDDMIRTLLGL